MLLWVPLRAYSTGLSLLRPRGVAVDVDASVVWLLRGKLLLERGVAVAAVELSAASGAPVAVGGTDDDANVAAACAAVAVPDVAVACADFGVDPVVPVGAGEVAVASARLGWLASNSLSSSKSRLQQQRHIRGISNASSSPLAAGSRESCSVAAAAVAPKTLKRLLLLALISAIVFLYLFSFTFSFSLFSFLCFFFFGGCCLYEFN